MSYRANSTRNKALALAGMVVVSLLAYFAFQGERAAHRTIDGTPGNAPGAGVIDGLGQPTPQDATATASEPAIKGAEPVQRAAFDEGSEEVLVGTVMYAPKRGLLVRVKDVDGELVNGVPVCLFIKAPDGKWVTRPNEFRFSGQGDQKKLQEAGQAWDPQWKGQVVWGKKTSALRELWSALDQGRSAELPDLGVGYMVPAWSSDGETLREIIVLDPAAWPAGGVDLVLPEAAQDRLTSLRVAVFFEDGSPAPGIDVGLFGIPLSRELGNGSFLDVARTDAGGVAQVPLTRALQTGAMFSSMGRAGPGLRGLFEMHVAADLPSLEPVRIPMPEDPSLGETLRLDLPPLVHLRAAFYDQLGQPYDGGQEGLEVRGNWKSKVRRRDRNHLKSIRTLVASSSMDLGYAGLGLGVEINAWPKNGDVPSVSASMEAQDEAGEVTLRFDFGQRFLRLAWDVLDPEGHPLCSKSLQFLTRPSDLEVRPERKQARYWRAGETDAKGRFLWIMRSDLRQAEVLELKYEEGDSVLYGSVELPMHVPPRPRAQRAGTMPVSPRGELHLSSAPLPELPQPLEQSKVLLASGRVVDSSGAPLSRVTVSAWGTAYASRGRMASNGTDADGRFVLETKKPAPFYLRLDKRGLVAQNHYGEAALNPGAEGLSFEMQAAQELAVTFQDWNLPFGNSLVIEARGNGKTHQARRRSAEGFVFDQLTEGEYEVILRTKRSKLPLAKYDEVQVSRDPGDPDPRLQDIDFKALAYARWYQLEDPAGTPVSAEEVYLGMAEHPNVRAKYNTNGTSRFFAIVPRDVSSVQITVPGAGFAWVPTEDEDVVVRLQPGG